MRQLRESFEKLSKPSGDKKQDPGAQNDASESAAPRRHLRADDPLSPVPDYTEGLFAPLNPAPGYEPTPAPPTDNSQSAPSKWTLLGSFGPGFQFHTEDEKYRLEIHYESQIEGRVFAQANEVPANSGLFLPRQRIFFNGNITEPIEYEFAINRGLNNFNLLNAFINLHFDDAFELRFGRFFTPVLYEQYAISNYWLPTPERSLFSTNLGLNRQIGIMGWGYLFDKRLDYAAGVFNGSRNSFENLSNGVELTGYLNARPFQESTSMPFLRFLNVGSSIGFGHQDQPPSPAALRVGAGSPDTNIPGAATIPFMVFNPNVIEEGGRVIGSVHAAYYLKGLSLIGEWQYGFGSYTTPDRAAPASVPFSGFYAEAGYFLTGEEVERRTRVTPLRPLIPLSRDQECGGAPWRRSHVSANSDSATRSSPMASPTQLSGPTPPSRPKSA